MDVSLDETIRRTTQPVRGTSARYGTTATVLAIAHRGGAALAPENTLEAFARSYALGVRYLETDVRVTADGVCVAFHDAELRRVTGRGGRVATTTWADLSQRRVLDRHPVPRIEDVLRAFPDAHVAIDLKDSRAIGPLARALRSCGATSRVCIGGSADRWMADVRAVLGPEVTTSMGWESLVRLASGTTRGVVPAPFAHVPRRIARIPGAAERFVDLAHSLGSRVLVWTVDDPAEMNRLLDLGADGIFTDRPDLLRDVLIARGTWTPPPSDRG